MNKRKRSVNWGGGKSSKAIILTLCLIVLLVLVVPGPTTQTTVAKVQPVLLNMAVEEPDSMVEVIVQKTNDDNRASLLAENLGAVITKDLHILNAFAAQISAEAVMELAQSPDVSWIRFDSPVMQAGESGNANAISFRSDFNDSSHGNDWAEVDENDGLQGGDVAITNFLGGALTGVRIQGVENGIQRRFDLSNALHAMLSIGYRRKGFEDNTDYVAIEISHDGGESWTEVERLAGPITDPNLMFLNLDITPFMSDEVFIRFISSATFSNQSKFYIDFVQIEYLTEPETPQILPYSIMLPFVLATGSEGLAELGGLSAPTVLSSDNVRDEFNNYALSNNDGSVNWSTNWIETGDDGSPGGYDITVEYDEDACPNEDSRCLEIDADNLNDSIERGVDLSEASSATLTFNYQIDTSGSAYNLEASTDGGQQWDSLKTYSAATTVFGESVDLSAYLSANTRIRFRVIDTSESANMNLDNVDIAYEIYSNSSSPPVNTSPEMVRDEFNAVAYGNNDGTMLWGDSWVEYDPDGWSGVSGGYVYVQNGRLTFHYLYYENIIRHADLSNYNNATLSFDWQTSGLDYSEAISVFVSQDGYNFTELESFGGSQSGTAQYDISNYISENTAVKIANTGQYWESGEYAYFDNIQIAQSCAECVDTNGIDNTYVQVIQADEVWNEAPYLQGQGVTVAVLDSGIAEHIDLTDAVGNSRILTHVQFMTNASSPDDLYGHGTHIAGSIAGNGLQSNGVYMGVAPQANLVDVKVIDDHGLGYTSDVVEGIQWIYENKDAYNIRVVNVSLNAAVVESYEESPLDAALEILWFNGITVVVSAGNNGNGPDGYLYAPANDPFFITVGATDDMGTPDKGDDILASFSAHGNTQGGFQKPDVLAPGVDIVSLNASDDSNLLLEHPKHAVTGPDGNIYFRMSGTSMSSGIVSGSVALIIQNQPDLTPDQVKYRLMYTGDYFATPTPGPKSVAYLNVPAAINSTSTESANQDVVPNLLLAKMALIAYWASENGSETIDWNAVDWDSVNWDTVDWEAVDWDSVNWGSVNWGSVNWGSVNWGSVNWGSVNWGSVNWGSVNWGSVNWGSVNWGSVNWGSVDWDD